MLKHLARYCLITWLLNSMDFRSRVALLDGLEEGGVRAYSSSHEIDEHSNDRGMEGLQDRVNFLKRVGFNFHFLLFFLVHFLFLFHISGPWLELGTRDNNE